MSDHIIYVRDADDWHVGQRVTVNRKRYRIKEISREENAIALVPEEKSERAEGGNELPQM